MIESSKKLKSAFLLNLYASLIYNWKNINDDIDHNYFLNCKRKSVFYLYHLTIDDLGDNLKQNFAESCFNISSLVIEQNMNALTTPFLE